MMLLFNALFSKNPMISIWISLWNWLFFANESFRISRVVQWKSLRVRACWRRACLCLSDYFPPPEVPEEGLARPVVAGIVATICFLAAAILFSTLAVCFVNKQRRRKLKRRRGQTTLSSSTVNLDTLCFHSDLRFEWHQSLSMKWEFNAWFL